MAQTVRSHAPASGTQHAATAPRNRLRESPNQWPRNRGLDTATNLAICRVAFGPHHRSATDALAHDGDRRREGYWQNQSRGAGSARDAERARELPGRRRLALGLFAIPTLSKAPLRNMPRTGNEASEALRLESFVMIDEAQHLVLENGGKPGTRMPPFSIFGGSEWGAPCPAFIADQRLIPAQGLRPQRQKTGRPRPCLKQSAFASGGEEIAEPGDTPHIARLPKRRFWRDPRHHLLDERQSRGYGAGPCQACTHRGSQGPDAGRGAGDPLRSLDPRVYEQDLECGRPHVSRARPGDRTPRSRPHHASEHFLASRRPSQFISSDLERCPACLPRPLCAR